MHNALPERMGKSDPVARVSEIEWLFGLRVLLYNRLACVSGLVTALRWLLHGCRWWLGLVTYEGCIKGLLAVYWGFNDCQSGSVLEDC